MTGANPGADASPEDAAKRWQLTEELFHRALELDAGERVEQVAAWCGADVDLRESVVALLEAGDSVEELISTASEAKAEGSEAENFLSRPSGDDSGAFTATGLGGEGEDDAWIGRELGPFRLERLLGRGGMGVVYLARRIAGGFEQTAAIKLVGRHLRSSPAIAQFLVERQTLATLEHAHIARLLDGGVTSEGFPYVVMEYVEGRRLDVASDDPATSTEQIIDWMLQLCDAVSYVHRNLILHRDLKPGNVMVTDDGSIKLLDFGTLKRIGPESTTDSAMTQAGLRAVSVRYASSEHIQGSAVSTATDVFSLGMILYRLIAGRLPEGLGDLAIGQYLEALKEERFTPPSQSAQQTGRRGDTGIARDLDAIVARTLRDDPQARYPTASALADDLWNVLASQPVTARAGNFRYYAGKFYRRYRWPVRAAAAVVLVLALGVAGMAWQGQVARRQELRAEQGVKDERQLAHMLLFDYFEQLRQIPGSVAAQRTAVTRALAYLDHLAAIAPDSDLELDTIGGYTDMGDLLGDPYEQNLGNVPEAISALNKALMLAEPRVAKHPHDLESLVMLASTYRAIGGTYMGNGNAVKAESYLLAGTKTVAEMAKDPKVTGEQLQQASGLVDLLGDVYDPGRGYSTADLSKSMQMYLLSDGYDEMCEKVDPKNRSCSSGIVVGDYKVGLLMEESDPALSAERYRHGMSVVKGFTADEAKTTRSLRMRNYMLSRLGLMELRIGPEAEGMSLARAAQAGFREAIANAELDNRARFDLVAFETDLSDELGRDGREREAAETGHEVLDVLAVLLQRSPKNLRWQMIQAQDRMTCGRAETKLGHKAAGSALTQKGMEQAVGLAEAKDATPEVLDNAAEGLIELHLKAGDAARAEEFAQRAVNSYIKPPAARVLVLAKTQSAAGHSQQAAKTARLVLASLAAPVKSKMVADEIADARRLVSGESSSRN